MATSAPRRKRAYHHGDLRRALVAAALSLLEKKGPEAFTLREAAAAVGVTHAAAYRHFEDKTALFAAVAEEGFRQLSQRLARVAREDGSPRERLHAIAVAYVTFAMDHPAHYRVMSGPRLNEDERFPSLEAAIAEALDVVVRIIVAGQAAGALRPLAPRDMAVTVWLFGHGYAELVHRRRIAVKSPRVAVAYFERLLEPLLDGLCTKAEGRTRGRS